MPDEIQDKIDLLDANDDDFGSAVGHLGEAYDDLVRAEACEALSEIVRAISRLVQGEQALELKEMNRLRAQQENEA